MNKQLYENAMSYYKEVGSLLNDDRKYVDKIEKKGELEQIETDVQKYVYEMEYKLYFKPRVFEDKSERHIQKVLRNHFGSWFALLEGGSRNITVESSNGEESIVKIRYVADNPVFED